jgi:uncharacterized protein (DUF58 family)
MARRLAWRELHLLPTVSAFLVAFAVVAAVAVAAVLAAAVLFFSENHTIRVRRNESVFSYYGHLALGH